MDGPGVDPDRHWRFSRADPHRQVEPRLGAAGDHRRAPAAPGRALHHEDATLLVQPVRALHLGQLQAWLGHHRHTIERAGQPDGCHQGDGDCEPLEGEAVVSIDEPLRVVGVVSWLYNVVVVYERYGVV